MSLNSPPGLTMHMYMYMVAVMMTSLLPGVSLGGQCSCGDSYGKHGLADEDWCMTRCVGGYVSENCGGNSTNAVYRVVRGEV